jgi:MoaA/NifB/PqqE/SkfB family radical SAM enzyme
MSETHLVMDRIVDRDFGPRRLSIELTNICNLHCSYCLRDEDALYHTPANFLSLQLLETIFNRATDVMGLTNVGFTGGEPTLHPEFTQVLDLAAAKRLKFSFVTNGWHFDRVWPAVVAHRDSITNVSFSLDGPTREEHDHWRGEGSFIRLAGAFSRCYGNGVPFNFKVTLRRDTVSRLDEIALFAARMGASYLSFAHVLPTSNEVENSTGLTVEERRRAEQEIANLSRIFKMKIGLDVGYHNLDPAPPCSPLAGVSANIDYRGWLSLCCNLSGFRGAVGQGDVIADLNTEDFGSAFEKLSRVASAQLEARAKRLTMLAEQGVAPDLYASSPCLLCLDTFGKLPWRGDSTGAGAEIRSLPVLAQFKSPADSTQLH